MSPLPSIRSRSGIASGSGVSGTIGLRNEQHHDPAKFPPSFRIARTAGYNVHGRNSGLRYRGPRQHKPKVFTFPHIHWQRHTIDISIKNMKLTLCVIFSGIFFIRDVIVAQRLTFSRQPNERSAEFQFLGKVNAPVGSEHWPFGSNVPPQNSQVCEKLVWWMKNSENERETIFFDLGKKCRTNFWIWNRQLLRIMIFCAGIARDSSGSVSPASLDAKNQRRERYRQIFEDHIPREFYALQRSILDLLRAVRRRLNKLKKMNCHYSRLW